MSGVYAIKIQQTISCTMHEAVFVAIDGMLRTCR
jgi:hypothetical protein